MSRPSSVYNRIQDEIDAVLIGNEDTVEQLTIALLTRGHVLMEGVPGVAKTTIAQLFARATGLDYTRIQMTPDTLPADITGTTIYREQTSEFVVQKGPIFANVVVADEINRATPKTQSALLEAMQERTVTIDGETHDLPSPFLVVATQNPLEMEGTFELPEAQRDRFQFKLSIDLPDQDDEAQLLDQFDTNPQLGPTDITAVVEPDTILSARETVMEQHVAQPVKQYILDIVDATRERPTVEHGASPRASIMLLNAAKARAAIHDRSYVIPNDIKSIAEPLLAHRLVLSTDAELSEREPGDVIDDIIQSVPLPSADVAQSEPTETKAVSDGGQTNDNDEESTNDKETTTSSGSSSSSHEE